MKTYEITIYQQTNTNGVIKLYCTDCKPSGTSSRGTLVVSGYDHFCSGCGNDFLEMAQEQQVQSAEKPAVGTLVRFKTAIVDRVWRITRYYSDNYWFTCELVGEPERTEYRTRVWNLDDVTVQ